MRWSVTHDAINDAIGRESLKEINQIMDVFVSRRDLELTVFPKNREVGIANNVKIMEFHGIDSKPSHFVGGLNHLLHCFVRKAEHKVGTDLQAPSPGAMDRIFEAGKVMSAVEPIERMLVDGLETKLD